MVESRTYRGSRPVTARDDMFRTASRRWRLVSELPGTVLMCILEDVELRFHRD